MEFSITFTEEETELLRRLAARTGRSPEEEARIAIREYLVRAGRAPRRGMTSIHDAIQNRLTSWMPAAWIQN
ncbi:ribbon-helix-helix protein, CopG family [Jiangella muralis]|uniref:ribbon-helix-helix protein, CopG family n=1 Tax=Jiangella muralis TaxID=702383 RepID=UPI00069EFA41|nr:ribbon-helix-helix protein, CopG family [Jiangella muralis]